MRAVDTIPPSFPQVAANTLLDAAAGVRWQVLCGDAGHWRLGVYSPPEITREEIEELEWHDCPELFVLLDGRLSLLLVEGGRERRVDLEPGRPTLVTAPHTGLCPDGPHTGRALVVERDAFHTEYRTVTEWVSL